jgi:hypothetical protein
MTSGDHAFKLLDDTVKQFAEEEVASDEAYVDPFIKISSSTAQLN